MTPAIYVPTLVDSGGHRHIIPARDQPALCGAVGLQYGPLDWRIDTLCLRCRQKYMRGVLGERLKGFGL